MQEPIGKVFVFNTNKQIANLVLNSMPIKFQMPAVIAQDHYRPSVISVGRNPALQANLPEFCQFNQLVITMGETSLSFDIHLDAEQYPLNQDLMLYLMPSNVIVTSGNR